MHVEAAARGLKYVAPPGSPVQEKYIRQRFIVCHSENTICLPNISRYLFLEIRIAICCGLFPLSKVIFHYCVEVADAQDEIIAGEEVL
jgi:hypothetical protein